MSAPGIRHRRPSSRSAEERFRAIHVGIALLGAALAGLLLAFALSQSTSDISRGTSAASIENVNTPGKNASGLPVVTETTLGTEVQRLIDSGSTLQAPANFDVNRCLQAQGFTDTPLVMEEIEWGADRGRYWLIVHAPNERDALRAGGGLVNVTVVQPSCGSATPPADSRAWAGSATIGGI